MKEYFSLILLALSFAVETNAQDSTEIYLRQHIFYLASDDLGGRRAGSKGAELSAQYISRRFSEFGLLPLGDSGTYFQQFEFISEVSAGKNNFLKVTSKKTKATYVIEKDFRPLPFSSTDSISGSLVFAGYGISAPSLNYNDYENLNVKDKIVVVMRYTPEGDSPHSEFSRFAALRYKTMQPRERGAKGLVLVTGSMDDSVDQLAKVRFDNSFSSSGIPAIIVTRAVANSWLGKALDSLQSKINRTKRPSGCDIPGVIVELHTEVIPKEEMTENVVGLLKVEDTSGTEYLIIGAHYDHLGMGGEGSLAPDSAAIHNGADDNASGTGALIELARTLSRVKIPLRRNIVFIAFSAEEEGSLGSLHFTKHPPLSLSSADVMVNLDMVGRLRNRELTIQGTGTSSRWDSLLTSCNSDSSFVLKFVKDGYGPSDHASFYANNIPVLFFFTGLHEDYHKPSDDAEKISYSGESLIVRYAARVASAIDTASSRPDFLKTQAVVQAGSDSRGFRVYVGTVPDYSEQTQGLRLSAVRDNSPASKAGLQGGDVVIQFGKFEVKNIYDYTFALQEYKPGDEVEIVVLRGKEKVTARVKLERRN